ncbi:hypothetical protein [Ereboglobus sp. PH5-10]|uniref:hypothetical protein n=1 Tax=Ereboglobus sp. PH5-10 TaxID=2940629 RepID=UPI0024057F49|nr:hypothetical protein [Ereboglobus sp. PH5-10]
MVVEPDYAMTEENVTVGCSNQKIVVTGYYKFIKIQKKHKPAQHGQSRSDTHFEIKLPVPVPKSIKTAEGLIEKINPVLQYNDKEYRPKYESNGATIITNIELFPNAYCALFRFNIPVKILKQEAVFSIHYDQPIIEIDGKSHASYVPFIPYAGEVKLDENAFVITFEARTGVTLQLRDPATHKVIQKKADQVSLKAENGKIIYVEIIPSSDSSTISQ